MSCVLYLANQQELDVGVGAYAQIDLFAVRYECSKPSDHGSNAKAPRYHPKSRSYIRWELKAWYIAES